jgi:hypothetical protein
VPVLEMVPVPVLALALALELATLLIVHNSAETKPVQETT